MNPKIITENPAVPAEDVLEVLRQVIDPELGLDIVNLGLVYSVNVVGPRVQVSMTLTTPGCPLHGTITNDARYRLERLTGIEQAEVELVWQPAWTPAAMSEEARRQVGWL